MSNWLNGYDLYMELEELRGLADDDETELDEEDTDRLAALEGLDDEIGLTRDTETLIPDYDFSDYARQLADDVGMIDEDSAMANYIDWDAWADDLRQDYSCVTFEGTNYYYRA